MKCRRIDAIDAPLLDWSDSTTTRSDDCDGDDDDDDGTTTSSFSYSLHQRRRMHQLLRADVHRCKSLACPACSLSHKGPTFLPTPKVDPASIRRLPPRWWDTATVAPERDCFHRASVEWTETFNEVCRCNESSPRVAGPVIHPIMPSERIIGIITIVTSPKESCSTDDTELTNRTVAWATKTCLRALDDEDSDSPCL